jgi:ankyrin repeat protein
MLLGIAILCQPITLQASAYSHAYKDDDSSSSEEEPIKKDPITILNGNLLYNARQGYTKSAKENIEKGADVNTRDKKGATPLYYVAGGEKDDPELFIYLIGKGADLEGHAVEENKERGTYDLIHIASANGNYKIVEYLLQRDPQLQSDPQHGSKLTSKGYSPLDIAIKNKEFAVAKLLISDAKSKKVDPFFSGKTSLVGCLFGDSAELSFLLDYGNKEELNRQDPKTGNTPLHLAAKKGKKELVVLLLKYTPNGNIENFKGMTPADMARGHYDQDVFNMLKDYENSQKQDKQHREQDEQYRKDMKEDTKKNYSKRTEQI